MKHLSAGRQALLGSIFLGALAATSLELTSAHAQIATCRSDPHVFLSNGVKVDLAMNFNDMQSDVQRTTFTLHIPKNASVNQVVYTDTIPETLTVVADNPGHRYTATGTGYTKKGGVVVTETFNIVNQESDGSLQTQAPGSSGQPVTVDATTQF